MANQYLFSSRRFLLLICAILMVITESWSVGASGDHQHQLGWIPTGVSTCKGSMAECLAAGELEGEFLMDSEINRRILATTKYISYGALQRNSVPCSRRGTSYYNCQQGGQANPYNRGCSAITRCRSWSTTSSIFLSFFFLGLIFTVSKNGFDCYTWEKEKKKKNKQTNLRGGWW